MLVLALKFSRGPTNRCRRHVGSSEQQEVARRATLLFVLARGRPEGPTLRFRRETPKRPPQERDDRKVLMRRRSG